jgi:hypothetical protein
MQKEQRYRSQLDPMLLGYVVPLLNSSYGHLRAKAVWLAGTFADARFAEGQGRGSTFNTLLQGVVAALGDPELPVRVNAAVAGEQARARKQSPRLDIFALDCCMIPQT